MGFRVFFCFSVAMAAVAQADEHILTTPGFGGAKTTSPKRRSLTGDEARSNKKQILLSQEAGTVLVIDKDGKLSFNPPGIWEKESDKLAYREIATATKGLVIFTPAEHTYRMIDTVLDHTQAGMSQGRPELDIAIVVDTTSSMGSAIDAVKRNLVKLSKRALESAGADIRVGVIEFRDRGDNFVTKLVEPLSYDMSIVSERINALAATGNGGGDSPEASLDGLHAAIRKLAWRPDAEKRIILISDEGPQPMTQEKLDYQGVLKRLEQQDGMTVYPVVVRHSWRW